MGVGVIDIWVGLVSICGMTGAATDSSGVACWPHPKIVDIRMVNSRSFFMVRIQVSELAL